MSNSDEFMVTTFDNIYNPFTHYREWMTQDERNGYNTQKWIASMCMTSSNLSEFEINNDVEIAVNEFLELNPFGMHYKVYKDEAEKLIPIVYDAYMSQKDKNIS